MYTAVLSSVGNPDHREFYGAGVLSATITESDETIEGLVRKIKKYRDDNCLGGGNFVDPLIRRDGTPICRVSYNMRLWKLAPNDTFKEVLTSIDESLDWNDDLEEYIPDEK